MRERKNERKENGVKERRRKKEWKILGMRKGERKGLN